jgi:hypothetical protein
MTGLATSVVLPPNVGVVLFVVVPPGELFIDTDAAASATGPATNTPTQTAIAANRPLSTLITVPPP